MKKKVKVIFDMDISYPYVDENQSIIDQFDITLSKKFLSTSLDKSYEPPKDRMIPILNTIRKDKVCDVCHPVEHQGSGSISITIERDGVVIGKYRYDELADDF